MKKIWIVVLMLALAMTATTAVWAADTETDTETDTVVGYSSARVEQVDLSDVPNILEYADFFESPEAFQITSAQGLEEFSVLSNLGEPFKGVTIYLANDIDMSEIESFEPIGNGRATASFQGIFDGQGHVIDNLKVSVTAEDRIDNILFCGLFGTLVNATVKNLVIGSGCEFVCTSEDTDARTGAVAANVGAAVVIDNVYNLGTVKGQRNTGGIVGFLDGYLGTDARTISNCTNAGTVSTNHGPTGGIVGMVAQPSLTVINCRNVGAVNGLGGTGETDTFNATGGIAGRCFADNLTITGCINNGPITSANAMAGGILGGMQDKNTASITDCVNYGELSGLVTGIYNAAEGITVTVTNCEDLAGETDESLEDDLEEIVPDFPSDDDDNPGGDSSDTEQPGDDDNDPTTPGTGEDETQGEDTTKEPEQSREPENSGEDTTQPSGNEPADDDGGCASSVSGGLIVLALCAAALTGIRKKKD